MGQSLNNLEKNRSISKIFLGGVGGRPKVDLVVTKECSSFLGGCGVMLLLAYISGHIAQNDQNRPPRPLGLLCTACQASGIRPNVSALGSLYYLLCATVPANIEFRWSLKVDSREGWNR